MAFPPGDIETFRKILIDLLSGDNEVRANAELLYGKVPTLDKSYLLLDACNDDSIRTTEHAELAAVLLRRLIASEFDETYNKMRPNIQNQMKTSILLRIAQRSISVSLRKKVSDVAAELARNCIDENGTNLWSEYLSFLFDGACSTDPVLREIVLLMFAAAPGVFGNQQNKYVPVICRMLSQTLNDQESMQVCYAAVKAFTAFILANEKELQVQKQFQTCLPIVLDFFEKTLEIKDADPDEVLRSLVDLVEACPQFFRPQLNKLIVICLKCLRDTEHLASTYQLSLEVIVTLCEAAPAMVRRLGKDYIPDIILCSLKMMTDLEDIPNWDFIDDDNSSEEENDSNANVAEASLDRLACALGGKTVLGLVMAQLQLMLCCDNWKERYAGLMAISAIGEGCHKQMTLLLPLIVDGVLPYLSDSNTRVRYAACNALGQMSTDFATTFQKKYHKVIPELLKLLGDPSSPRVQAHAGAALVNFFEECPKSVLTPYMTDIVQRLEGVLSSKLKELADKGTKLVLEQVVVTLASLADSAQDKFVEYYDDFMPCLKCIIKNTNHPHLLILRGKTIECVSLIGLAVGKEKFLPDANEVMELLLKSQTAGAPIADDDPQLSYMITAWARICKILGKGFEPYLQFVMGPVLKAASLKPEIAVVDSDDMKVVGNDDDWEFVNLGDNKHNFGIRTAGLDDKATACQMLVCYAKELKESFAAYVEETVHLMVPMLKFYFHDGVRTAAGEILPCLLESAKVKGENYLQDMWRFILPPLLQALDTEPEPEVLCEHMTAFAQCLDVLNCHCLTQEDLMTLINTLNKYLENYFKKCADRESKRTEEDYDEALEEDLLKEDDEDVYVLSKISEIICALFAAYKHDFLDYFEMLLPHFSKLLDQKRNWQDHQWSLYVFADIIEHCGPACSRYETVFLQPLLNSLNNENANLRQTAAYALGALAFWGGPSFCEFCAKNALPALVEMINKPYSRSDENERATENAISSITKIFMTHNPLINADDIIPTWLTWLPIWEDDEEVRYVFNVLSTLMEVNHAALLGNDNCNLPRIVHIIADAFCKEAIEPSSDVGKRVITLLRDIQNNAELFSICVNHLTPEQQEALHLALLK